MTIPDITLAGDEHIPGDFERNAKGQPRVKAPDSNRTVTYDRPSAWPFDDWSGIDMIYANRGTWVHTLTEHIDLGDTVDAEFRQAGVALGIPLEVQREIALGWIALLEHFGIVPVHVEVKVVNDTHRVAGTADRVFKVTRPIDTPFGTIHAGDLVLVDIKTGGNVVKASYAAQLPLYADGVPYDVDTGERGSWDGVINPHVGFIAHYPLTAALKGEAVGWTLVPVDLDAGRVLADALTDLRNATGDGVFGEPLAPPSSPTAAAPSAPVEVEADTEAGAPSPAPASVDLSTARQVRRAELLSRHAALDDGDKERFAAMVVNKTDLDAIEAALDELTRHRYVAASAAHEALVDAIPERTTYRDMSAAGQTKAINKYVKRPVEEGDEVPADSVEAIRRRIALLTVAQRDWSRDVGGEVRLNPDTGGVPSERRFEVMSGVTWLALNEFDNDDIVRAICHHLVGDVAHFANITPARLVGALTLDEARRFRQCAEQVVGGAAVRFDAATRRCFAEVAA